MKVESRKLRVEGDRKQFFFDFLRPSMRSSLSKGKLCFSTRLLRVFDQHSKWLGQTWVAGRSPAYNSPAVGGGQGGGVKSTRGSLLIIFLFTVGVLGIIMTGLYFVITNAVVQQSLVEAAGKKKMVEESFEQIHKSELDRLLKNYISTGLNPTTAFDSSHYTTALDAAENWAFPNATVVSSGVGTVSATIPPVTPFSKNSDQPPSMDQFFVTDNFLEHPLSFAPGYVPIGSLSANYTPAWSNTAFAYNRQCYCYK